MTMPNNILYVVTTERGEIKLRQVVYYNGGNPPLVVWYYSDNPVQVDIEKKLNPNSMSSSRGNRGGWNSGIMMKRLKAIYVLCPSRKNSIANLSQGSQRQFGKTICIKQK
jgi:hypothetical protein